MPLPCKAWNGETAPPSAPALGRSRYCPAYPKFPPLRRRVYVVHLPVRSPATCPVNHRSSTMLSIRRQPSTAAPDSMTAAQPVSPSALRSTSDAVHLSSPSPSSSDISTRQSRNFLRLFRIFGNSFQRLFESSKETEIATVGVAPSRTIRTLFCVVAWAKGSGFGLQSLTSNQAETNRSWTGFSEAFTHRAGFCEWIVTASPFART